MILLLVSDTKSASICIAIYYQAQSISSMEYYLCRMNQEEENYENEDKSACDREQ